MNDTRDILLRLDRIEHENRRLRRAWALAVLLFLPLVLAQCGGGGGQVVAERFVVRDAEGRTRALLGLEDGQVRLRLFDEAGGRRASLALTREGEPGLALFHDAERPGSILEVTAKGPSIALLDRKANVVFRRP